ncbi:hypothetical protein MNQ98_03775 [Paenibacillus sp. N3/727]|nr:hypothetical protein [Paenibacillus sp. N3/727]UNK19167.1 hypothetical protein MNQ98_03775 [Paenibacillus sp. N3/727]
MTSNVHDFDLYSYVYNSEEPVVDMLKTIPRNLGTTAMGGTIHPWIVS